MTKQNKWIADRGYGTGMALAFEGEPDFVKRSINFAANFLLSEKSEIRQETPTFAVINTTMENLTKAFELEGYCLRMRELLKTAENPMDLIRDEDFPADWDERLDKFSTALLSAKNAKEVAEIMKTDPMRGLEIVETPEMVADATAWGKNYAKDELAKIVFEDFMRHVSHSPISTHAVSEIA